MPMSPGRAALRKFGRYIAPEIYTRVVTATSTTPTGGIITHNSRCHPDTVTNASVDLASVLQRGAQQPALNHSIGSPNSDDSWSFTDNAEGSGQNASQRSGPSGAPELHP
jgi:hypothetical protein